MSTKKQTFKTVDTWKKELEEIFTNNGLTPKWGHKTGSCIMPAEKKYFASRNDFVYEESFLGD